MVNFRLSSGMLKFHFEVALATIFFWIQLHYLVSRSSVNNYPLKTKQITNTCLQPMKKMCAKRSRTWTWTRTRLRKLAWPPARPQKRQRTWQWIHARRRTRTLTWSRTQKSTLTRTLTWSWTQPRTRGHADSDTFKYYGRSHGYRHVYGHWTWLERERKRTRQRIRSWTRARPRTWNQTRSRTLTTNFDIVKKLENLVWPPPCVSTSVQRTFAPPLFEILNMPLDMATYEHRHWTTQPLTWARTRKRTRFLTIGHVDPDMDTDTETETIMGTGHGHELGHGHW